MEPVFLELHGDWSRVNGPKLENGKSSKGHDNGKTLEDITQKDCEVSTQISRLLNATEDQKISSVSFQPVRFNSLWIFLALVKYSSASEDRESNENFHCFLHLAEEEVQDEILVKPAPGLQRKSWADCLKILNKRKK